MTPRSARYGALFVGLLLAFPTCAEAGDTEEAKQLHQAGADIGYVDTQQESVGFSGQLSAKFFVTVFVTSLRYTGNLVKEANQLDPAPELPFNDTQGLDAGDFICNTHANWGGHGGHFAAWLSTEEVNAKDRLTPGSGPFLATDGVIIADNIPDLPDGTLRAPIILDELGLPIVNPNIRDLPLQHFMPKAEVSTWRKHHTTVWTGTRSDGTVYEGQHCNGWAHYEDKDDPSSATVGKVCDDCVGEWTLGKSLGCNWRIRSHLYCFQVRSKPEPGSSS